ncbi:MAG TPA: hypothetical protein VFW44_06720 [Bryobacteraceae bacterium]|nr:hypothetical protein [Bryobacteraceae bacterium]
MSKPTPAWLTTELEWGLHETSAPPELWDRVIGTQRVRSEPRGHARPLLVWAAAALMIVAIGLTSAYRRSAETHPVFTYQITGLHCQNPAELRAWVRADSEIRTSTPRPWVTGNRKFVLASNSAPDLQISCKLCHLD